MTPSFSIRRMLVALDLSAVARSSLPAALRLATQLNAEVQGLFVEDARLMALCVGEGLPTRHVSRVTGLPEVLDRGAMEAGLRAQSAALSRHVAATATALRHPCALRILRGDVAESLVAETDQGDLLVLSRRPGHVGPVLAATIRAVSAPMLILPPGANPGQGRVVVIADTTEFLEHALAAAERFRHDSRRTVEVVLASPAAITEADGLAGATGMPIRITPCSDDTDLSGHIPSDTDLVIVSPANPALGNTRLMQFLASVSKPVLLLK